MITTRCTVALAATIGLAGCGLFTFKEEVQTIVNNAVLDIPAGDFFSRYGPAYRSSTADDNMTVYEWASRLGKTPPGEAAADQRICKLRLAVNARGRIARAEVVLDDIGRVSASRCTEVFTGKQDVTSKLTPV